MRPSSLFWFGLIGFGAWLVFRTEPAAAPTGPAPRPTPAPTPAPTRQTLPIPARPTAAQEVSIRQIVRLQLAALGFPVADASDAALATSLNAWIAGHSGMMPSDEAGIIAELDRTYGAR